jgi:hypothetical protein
MYFAAFNAASSQLRRNPRSPDEVVLSFREYLSDLLLRLSCRADASDVVVRRLLGTQSPAAFAAHQEARPLQPSAIRLLDTTVIDSASPPPARSSGAPAFGAIRRLLSLSELKAGWDGGAGKAVSKATVDRAISCLSHLANAFDSAQLHLSRPIVGPTPDGTVLLEWDLDVGYLSVECSASEPFSFYIELPSGVEVEGNTQSVDGLADRVVAAFSGKHGYYEGETPHLEHSAS